MFDQALAFQDVGASKDASNGSFPHKIGGGDNPDFENLTIPGNAGGGETLFCNIVGTVAGTPTGAISFELRTGADPAAAETGTILTKITIPDITAFGDGDHLLASMPMPPVPPNVEVLALMVADSTIAIGTVDSQAWIGDHPQTNRDNWSG